MATLKGYFNLLILKVGKALDKSTVVLLAYDCRFSILLGWIYVDFGEFCLIYVTFSLVLQTFGVAFGDQTFVITV